MARDLSEREFIVYKHTSPSNKIYIGITCRTLNARWQNGKGYENNKHFWRAIQKYGWDNFKHEILFKGLSEDEACEKEIALINEYDSANCEKGYNKVVGRGGFRCGEEHPNKTNRYKKGFNAVSIICTTNKKVYNSISQASIDTGENIDSIRNNLNKVIKLTSKGLKFKLYYDYLIEHPNVHLVKDIDKDLLFNSEDEASKYYNLSKIVIRKICNKEYVHKYKDLNLEYVNIETLNKDSINKGQFKKVIDIDTLEVFDSTTQAGVKFKVTNHVIRDICSHKKKKDNGIHVLFLEEYESLTQDEIDNIFKRSPKFKTINGVKNITTGEIFENAKQASIGLGVKPQIILEAARSAREMASGYKWERIKIEKEIK